MFAIATHNGNVTISNPATGGHRTFQIRTQKADASFAPGERIVSLLTGPDNWRNYRGFGFVKSDGRIVLWRKNRTDTFRKFADMLENPERYADRVEYMAESKCRVCNKKLTTPESIESGIGPVCGGRE